jgi:SagB-type dehydrogenase family enzyme
MTSRFFFSTSLILMFAFAILALAQDTGDIKLLPPQLDHKVTLMQALQKRCSSRSFCDEKLPLQTLSNLLWAAYGINRPESGKRTAPSANNKQEVEVYVAMAEGLYLYNPAAHELKLLLKEDLRAKTGTQSFVAVAPANFVYVADLSKRDGEPHEKELMSGIDTGFISQNVYLCCAAEGLATVVRGFVDRDSLGKAMHLRPEQYIVVAQTVGYPPK